MNSHMIRSMDTNMVSKNLKWDMYFQFFYFSSIFKSVKSPASGKENVLFQDSQDFENLPDFRIGCDVW